jgi:NAD(P)H-dependent flavin oxidoreductase YrpB (nitropropane dioxygenase family)
LKDKKLIVPQQGNIEEGIVTAGQVAGYIDDIPTVQKLLETIIEEAGEAYKGLDVRDSGPD